MPSIVIVCVYINIYIYIYDHLGHFNPKKNKIAQMLHCTTIHRRLARVLKLSKRNWELKMPKSKRRSGKSGLRT